MKVLSYLFAVIAILFLLTGLVFMMQTLPTATTERVFFSCFFGGMMATVAFLVTDNLSKD